MNQSDMYAEHVVGRVPKHAMCAMVAEVQDRNGRAVPVSCAYAAGHRSLHSWSAMTSAGSKPPGPRGHQRTAAVRAARRR